MKKNLLAVLLSLALYTGYAMPDTASLNKLMNQFDKHQKLMASVCIFQNGIFEYSNAIGFADAAQDKKANVYTRYRIGSISKMFTAVMILQLIQEKKLSLDTKLKSFFPEIPNSDKITIAQLLSHRSGLFNFTMDPGYRTYMEKPKSEKEMIGIFKGFKPDFEPDAKFAYSNTNYVLLSYIIEKICKTGFDVQLLQRICAPAKLGDTHVGGRINTGEYEALSYNFENKKWLVATETDMSVTMGAGDIVSTCRDLCFFVEALFGGKLLAEDMLLKMKTLKDGYGFGMIRFPYGTKWFYGHTGGIDGFQSMLGYNPEDKMAFCILGNGFNYPINDVAIALLDAAYHKPIDFPVFEKKTYDPKEAYSPVGIYSNQKMGVKITVRMEGGQLTAQATGQSDFPLEKLSELEYRYEISGVNMRFIKEADNKILSFRLTQGGMEFLFERD